MTGSAIDILYLEMYCDDAARALGYLLKQAGMATHQFNMILPGNAHTALLARPTNGSEILLDPYTGVIPMQNGRPIGPEQARTLAQGGEPPARLWQLLLPGSKLPNFYMGFDEAVFARQGQTLRMISTVNLTADAPLQIGAADGSIADVIAQGNQARLTPHWHYLGSRYDRAWIRELRFPLATRVTFGLTEPVKTNLITTSQQPVIEGNYLIYDVPAGGSLIFHDAEAGYDWMNLRSHQDVDFVRFEAGDRTQPPK